ncbi:MAG: hypothetical protein II936_00225 [Oscillospiraceae bacterium]|nr:hypothetical protein [Oscillospiraceae bacterium]
MKKQLTILMAAAILLCSCGTKNTQAPADTTAQTDAAVTEAAAEATTASETQTEATTTQSETTTEATTTTQAATEETKKEEKAEPDGVMPDRNFNLMDGITMGMTASELKEILGEPDKEETFGGFATLTYGENSFSFGDFSDFFGDLMDSFSDIDIDVDADDKDDDDKDDADDKDDTDDKSDDEKDDDDKDPKDDKDTDDKDVKTDDDAETKSTDGTEEQKKEPGLMMIAIADDKFDDRLFGGVKIGSTAEEVKKAYYVDENMDVPEDILKEVEESENTEVLYGIDDLIKFESSDEEVLPVLKFGIDSTDDDGKRMISYTEFEISEGSAFMFILEYTIDDSGKVSEIGCMVMSY